MLVLSALKNYAGLRNLKREIQDKQCKVWNADFSGSELGNCRVHGKTECTPLGPEKKSVITRFCTTTDSNAIFHSQDESIRTDDPISVEHLLVVIGTYNNVAVNGLRMIDVAPTEYLEELLNETETLLDPWIECVLCCIREKAPLKYPQ